MTDAATTSSPPPAVDVGARPPITVVILTRDEEANIADCLASCGWCDDVHVLDSGSTDRTCEIAAAHGAAVHVHPFHSFGDQRNWAIDHIPHKHDWVFHLDADERFTPALVAEMTRAIGRADESTAGFFVPSKLMFMGRWLRHAAGGYPIYQMRLFHRGRMRFVDYGHGQREAPAGRIDKLEEPYLHFNFSKGIDDWRAKHERYAAQEAEQIVAGWTGGGAGEGIVLRRRDRTKAVSEGPHLAEASGAVDASVPLAFRRTARVSRRRARIAVLPVNGLV